MSALYRVSYGFTLARGYAAACWISLSAEFINTSTQREWWKKRVSRKRCKKKKIDVHKGVFQSHGLIRALFHLFQHILNRS